MPRISPEALAGAVFRAGSRPLPPPKRLNADQRLLWREIVASKAADWFDVASAELLVQLVATSCALRDSIADLAGITSMERDRLLKQQVMLATKLRLTPQANIRRASGKLGERGQGKATLLGGNVTPLRPDPTS
jgi:hypothetical protein